MRTKLAGFCCLLAACAVSCSSACAADADAAALAKEMASQMGTSWYGVYFGGKQKCGFAKMVTSKEQLGGKDVYASAMVLDVTIKMGNAKQKLEVGQTRYYAMTGGLVRVDSVTKSVMGDVTMRGEVAEGKLVLSTTMGGRTETKELPAPGESLTYVLAARRLLEKGEPGSTIEFDIFEPSMAKTIGIASKLLRFEDRLIGGVKTRIAVIETKYKDMAMASTDYVTMDGDLVETVFGALFTMRKESEEMAKDVRFAFDAMRAGITPVKEKLGDPRKVVSLKLRLSGIRKLEVLIDDGRQSYERGGEGEDAKHVVTLRPAAAPKDRPALPLKPPAEIAEHLKPTTFAQSDAPEIVKAAKQIVGAEKDPFAAACKIQRWVFANVEKKGMAALSNALDVLRQKVGDCSEHSVLFVALCRAAGIPARQVVGIGYSAEMGGFGYHAWGEVWVGDWVAMDPTWGEDLADPTHVKFAVGETESVGAVAGLFGSLKIEVVEFKTK